MRVCVLFGHGKEGLTVQGRARADIAISLFKAKKIDTIYIGAVTASAMRDYLVQEVPDSLIKIFPRGFTTASEISVLLPYIPKDALITSVSSTYHIPRIKLIWRSFNRKSYSRSTRTASSIVDVLREVPLLILACIYPQAFSTMTT